MQIPNFGYNLQKIVAHVYELSNINQKREYLNKQIEFLVKQFVQFKEENPRLYNKCLIPDVLSQAKGLLNAKEQFEADIDHLKFVLNSLTENENTTVTKIQNNPLVFPKETLNQVMNNDAVDKFIEIEKRLIEDGEFNEKGEFKTKDKCAALIIKLLDKGYFLPKKIKNKMWITKTVKPFFENRYQIEFSKQMQPKYRKDTKLSAYFTWIENIK